MNRKFNEFLDPIEFNFYMSKLQKERDRRLGKKSIDYGKENLKLVKEYLKSRSEAVRNKLIMLNITLAHEMFYKKLGVNLFKHDAIDILQEINMHLIEAVDKTLKSIGTGKTKVSGFSTSLYYRLLSSLGHIGEKYYDHKTTELDSESLVCEEEPERIGEDLKEFMYSRMNYCLGAREREILISYYLKGITISYISLQYGLTESRVHQIIDKAKRKLEEYQVQAEIREERHRTFRKNLQGILDRNPQIKYVLINPEYSGEIFTHGQSYTSRMGFGLLDKYLGNGINPKEWLILTSCPCRLERYEYKLFKVMFYPGTPYSDNAILDRFLMPVAENKGMYVFRFEIHREMRIADIEPLKTITKYLSQEEIDEIYEEDDVIRTIRNDKKHSEDWRRGERSKRLEFLQHEVLLREAVVRKILKKWMD